MAGVISIMGVVSLVSLAGLWVGSALLIKSISGVYYILVLVGGYLYFVNRHVTESRPEFLTLWFRWGWAVLAYLLFSALVFNEPKVVFGYRFEVFRELLWLPLVWVAISRIHWTDQLLFRVVACVSLYALVYDAMLIHEHPVRGEGLLETPISRGNMGMLWGLLALISFFGLTGWAWRAMALVGFLSGLMLSLLSGSRGGWGALLLGVFLLSLYLYRYKRQYFWWLIGAVVLAVLAVFVFWERLPVGSRIQQTLNSIHAYMNGNPHTSLGYRFEMWKAAWMAFMEKPLFGWGFGNFDKFFLEYLREGLVAGKATGWGHAHNDYLFVLSELGIVGFILVVGFFAYPFVRMLEFIRQALRDQNGTLLMVALLGAVLTEALFEFALSDQTFTVKYFMFVYVTLYMAIFSVMIRMSSGSRRQTCD